MITLLSRLFIPTDDRDAASSAITLLDVPPTHEFVSRIREPVMAHTEIIGIHNLIVHDYGAGRELPRRRPRGVVLHLIVSGAGTYLYRLRILLFSWAIRPR